MPGKGDIQIVRHKQGIKKGQRTGPKIKEREECGDPRRKEQIKPRGSWNAGMENPDPYRPPLPHVATINGTV